MTQMIAATYTTAAQLLDLEIEGFLRAVRDGDLPMPISIGGHTRWLIRDLESHATTSDTATAALLAPTMEKYGIET